MSTRLRSITTMPAADTLCAGALPYRPVPAERELAALRLLLDSPQQLPRQRFADELGLARAEADALAEQMLATGLVQETGTDRALSCGAPDIVVTRLLHSHQSQLAEQLRLQLMMHTAASRLSDAHRTETGHVPDSDDQDMARGRTLHGQREVRAAFDEAVCRARSEVLTLHPWMPTSPDGLLRSRERQQHLLEKGITVRAVYPDTVMQVPHGRAHLGALLDAGVQVRTAPCVPLRMLLVDGAEAYAATEGDGAGARALRLRGSTPAQMLREMFDYCWFQARQLHGRRPRAVGADQLLTDREVAMVRMLSEGRTDTAIARSLGVSPRTFRRLMAEVMERLGAASRFQAGVRAAQLGLLNAENVPITA